MELLKIIFAGGFAAAALKILFDFAAKRKTKIDALVAAQMVSMQDRIAYLGRAYIYDNQVTYDDRRRLQLMHEAYKGLGGNGDLNELMKEVYLLPLKGDK